MLFFGVCFFLVFSCFSVGLFDISKLNLVRSISLILRNRDFGYSMVVLQCCSGRGVGVGL